MEGIKETIENPWQIFTKILAEVLAEFKAQLAENSELSPKKYVEQNSALQKQLLASYKYATRVKTSFEGFDLTVAQFKKYLIKYLEKEAKK